MTSQHQTSLEFCWSGTGEATRKVGWLRELLEGESITNSWPEVVDWHCVTLEWKPQPYAVHLSFHHLFLVGVRLLQWNRTVQTLPSSFLFPIIIKQCKIYQFDSDNEPRKRKYKKRLGKNHIFETLYTKAAKMTEKAAAAKAAEEAAASTAEN